MISPPFLLAEYAPLLLTSPVTPHSQCRSCHAEFLSVIRDFKAVWKILTTWAVLLVLTNVPVQYQLFRATCHCREVGKAELHVAVPAMGAPAVPNLPALGSMQWTILKCCYFVICMVIRWSYQQTSDVCNGSVPLYTVRRPVL